MIVYMGPYNIEYICKGILKSLDQSLQCLLFPICMFVGVFSRVEVCQD